MDSRLRGNDGKLFTPHATSNPPPHPLQSSPMQITDNNQRQILSVSQLNRRTRQLLETHLPLIWVEGELSNLARPGSGHWYFSLKDDAAQVRCAMFRNRNNLVRFQPSNGMQVLLRCRVSLYEGRGEFQLIVEHMEEAGLGALQRRFDELKARLSAEGLFNPEQQAAAACDAKTYRCDHLTDRCRRQGCDQCA